jgi:hypothetical protein
LEHPATSSLWKAVGLPLGRNQDQWGGFTISVDQFWWGHRARKQTWLYVCGVDVSQVPAVPLRFEPVTRLVTNGFTHGKRKPGMKEISKAEREHTPPALARWLVELALQTKVKV